MGKLGYFVEDTSYFMPRSVAQASLGQLRVFLDIPSICTARPTVILYFVSREALSF